MSAGVEVWGGAVGALTSASAAEGTGPTYSVAPQPYASLVQQIFFSGGSLSRHRVLLAGADSHAAINGIGEQVARTLAGMKIGVALVEKEFNPTVRSGKKRPGGSHTSRFWSGFQVNDFLWRIPASTLADIEVTRNNSPNGLDLPVPFECIVCVNTTNDEMTPLFCSFCGGAVLVVTANRTRRDTALHAKRRLQQCGAELIGTVLAGRTYPIPESIYRRL